MALQIKISFFIRPPKSNCIIIMRCDECCGREGNYKFLNCKNVVCFFSRIFCCSIVEILNFIAYVDGHGIFFRYRSMISMLFLVAIIIFAYCYRIVYRNLCSFHPVAFSFNPWYRLAFNSLFIFGPKFIVLNVNCRFNDSPTFLMLRWQFADCRHNFCKFMFCIVQVTSM